MLLVCGALGIAAILLLAIGIDTQSEALSNAAARFAGSFDRPAVIPTVAPVAPVEQRPDLPSPAPEPPSPHGPVPIDAGYWITSDDYPALALQNELQGKVRIELAIDSNGKVSRCTVTQSSGAPLLDETTCELGRTRARFRPARDDLGRPVPPGAR